jgi:tetratricopeptide (TPR) repeat protein
MKKFFLLIVTISISLSAMSQKGKVTNALNFIEQGALDKAKDALDQALADPKSKDWFNTYFAKGKLCQASFNSDNPKFQAFFADPLQEAFNSYEKAIELDPKGSMKKKIIATGVYNSLSVDFYKQGSAKFETKEFPAALKAFENQIKINENEKYVGGVDTGMYYNAGIAAFNCQKYNESIKFFEKCAQMKYQGITPYYQMYQAYLGLGDTTKAEATLKSLPTIFPNDKTITLNLIDLYIKSNKVDEALKYIKVAKESDPANYNLFFAAGIIYLNNSKYDEAVAELTKSIELNPSFYETQYGIGAAYINKAADMFKAANDIMDPKKYNDAVEVANGVYAKALPHMEKALELKPNDTYTMQRLQELYYRLKAKDPSLAPKYDAIKAKLDALK